MATVPIAFITDDIPLSDADYIIDTINSYNPLRYLIVFEHPLGPKGFPHYHYLVWFTENNYNAFIKKVREKYNLRGKATAGKRKQYGRIKNIKSLEKLQSYMMKDQPLIDLLDSDTDCQVNQESNDDNIITYFTLNMSKSDLKKYQDASFKKDNQTATCYKCIDYVIKNLDMIEEYQSITVTKDIGSSTITYSDSIDYEKQVKLIMIQYHIEKDLRINRTTINNYYIEYIRSQFHKEGSTQTLTSTSLRIYDKLFN